MKARSHCTSALCPETRETLETVSITVSSNHPLLQLKRALPWGALFVVMRRHWRAAGKNVEGRPGLPWDVSLYVPLVVLMLIKNLDARRMEASLAENAVARVFINRQAEATRQIRDHSNIARAYAAPGRAGLDEVNQLVVQAAHHFGFVDAGILSADTTAEELPLGYPNEPGILRGLAQRCGRALYRLKQRGVWGLDTALTRVQTILRSVKEHHLFTPGKAEKREVLTRILRDVGQLVVETRPVLELWARSSDRVIQNATSTLASMHHVITVLMGQIVQWVTTGVVAKDKIIHVGIPQARAIVRNKAGKTVEFGLAYLISRLGGGYLFGTRIAANADEKTMPLQALVRSPGDARVGGVRPRRRCYPHTRAARARRGETDRDSAQGATGVASCRGSARSSTQRAGADGGEHWDVEKRQVQIQQAEGTSVADAGDGWAEVYFVVQSEQADVPYHGLAELNRWPIRADGRWKTGQNQEESRRARAPKPSREFCDTL